MPKLSPIQAAWILQESSTDNIEHKRIDIIAIDALDADRTQCTLALSLRV